MMKAAIFDLACILVCPDRDYGDGKDVYGDQPINNSKQDSIDILRKTDGITGIRPMDGLQRINDNTVSFWDIPYRGRTYALLPGVINFLKDLRHNGIKLGFASDDPDDLRILERTGIRNMFDAIVDSRHAETRRPCPEALCKAAQMLGVEPADCVVFESTPDGIEAAKCAGMKSVAVGDLTELYHADMGVPSLKGLTYQHILDGIYASVSC